MLEPEKYYHIYNRGNNRENIFKEEKNYSYFLKLYERHIDPVAETYAYCLMKNHFHLLVKIKEHLPSNLPGFQNLEGDRNPSRAFSNLFNAYTKSINKMYHRTGSLFEKNFHRIEVTSDSYFSRLVQYIHFNPQHHGFCDDFRTYPYSSFNIILSETETKINRNSVIQWFGGREEFIEFHKNVTKEKEIADLIGDDI
ncbi:MAG: transposase [Bacteroidota bacterium]